MGAPSLRTLVSGGLTLPGGAIDKNELPGLLLVATGTPDFFEGPQVIEALEPLHQRLKVNFCDDRPDNVRMPQLRMKPFDQERLLQVARRVEEIYAPTLFNAYFYASLSRSWTWSICTTHNPRAQYDFAIDRVADGIDR